MKTKFCPNCGSNVSAAAKHCPNCGYMFNNQSQPAPQQNHSYNQIKAKKKPKVFIYITAILIIVMIVLGGMYIYTNNNSAPNHSNITSSNNNNDQQNKSLNKDTSSSSSNNYRDSIDWNSDKAASFDNQFTNWADKMQQSYVSGSTNFDGVSYPGDFKHKQFIINGVESSISMAGSNRNTEYKVVEIRYDSEQGYLYLFAFHDGTPIVLFTQSGNADGNSVSFKTTANGQLKNIFAGFNAN